MTRSATITVNVTVGVKRKRSQIDGPEKQFVCDFPECEQKCKSKGARTRHERSHSEENAPPASFEGWKQHFLYKHVFGLLDGRVWSCLSGRFLKATPVNGYINLWIDGNQIQRHRLNFEIANGRAIGPGMEIDHIIAAPKPEEGCDRVHDDRWANLQELTSEEHRRKTLADNPGAGKKGGVTRGFPVMSLHVASGKEDRHDSASAAALTLDLDISTIKLRIRQGSSKEVGGYVFRRCPQYEAEQADRPGEVWKDCVYYDKPIKGVRVSTMGRVQLRNGRRTEGCVENGRHRVQLKVDKELVHIQVYNLVAHTFIGRPPTSKHTVDHKDGNCLNDVLSNLCWATKVEQGGNMKSNRVVGKYDLQEKLLTTYGTVTEAARENGLTRWKVECAAKRGSKSTGFIWKFEERVAAP